MKKSLGGIDMNTVKYCSLGPAVAGCWSIGKQMKK
jgi:hypothetical protein